MSESKRRIRFTNIETGETRIIPEEETSKLARRIMESTPKAYEDFLAGQPIVDDGGKYELLSEEESAELNVQN